MKHNIKLLTIIVSIFTFINCHVHMNSNSATNSYVVVNPEDGQFLNELFDSVRGNFDFNNKKILIQGLSVRDSLDIKSYKECIHDYLKHRPHLSDRARGKLIIYTAKEKIKHNGFDAIINQWYVSGNQSYDKVSFIDSIDGKFLNQLFESERGEFDFIDKKIKLFNSANISDYIDNLMSRHRASNAGWDLQAKGRLFIFTQEEKDSIGEIDAAIYSWMKMDIPKHKVLKRLQKEAKK